MMNTELGKVAVLMGGKSAEREISLLSGQAILTALLDQEVDAISIDIAERPVVELLSEQDIDRVFIALHGRGGEDGTIQGLLDVMGLPYTGSGVLGSALAMDKYRTKQVWQGVGLPTPGCTLITDSNFSKVIEQVGLPLMVKPVLEGSSVGISKVSNLDELALAYEAARQCDCPVMAESYITGIEYTAAILGETVLPLIRLETPRAFYDYTAKYSDDSKTDYICPCGLPAAQEKMLQDLALQAFLAVGARGWGRVDLLCDKSLRPWLIEVNTVPGMTRDHSLVPMAAKAAGISFDDLVLRILKNI
jgi:D-alanine-D-alanine ligase